ncbi:ISPsy25 [Pseudomonas savastanoi pv. phaseolicola]|nr:ISPsy25 [Pseudomonas savastanoi pv. phaseolicola]
MARVAEISATSVHKLWAANDLKAHLTSAFKLSRDPHLEENFWDVIGLYLDPPDKALLLCSDEKPSSSLVAHATWFASGDRAYPYAIT